MRETGSKLGPYEILSALGAGGMGEVYKARDTRLDREVAVKVLASHLVTTAEMRQRFEREARAISSLNHPNICILYDVGHDNGTDFLVMEFLEGETLAERIKKGPLPVKDVLRYGIEIADALDKAHRQGIVHRDLKPGNIMLTKAGAKLLDFGLAKPVSMSAAVGSQSAPDFSAALTISKANLPLTATGAIVGTMQYMAPEQIEGKGADARSDIFTFGALLYEMVTGKRAFNGKSQLSVASAILGREPEPISATQPLTPPALEHIIQRALAKDPAERWQSASDVKGELKWVSEAGSRVGTPALVGQHRPHRERVAWGLAALFVLATAASLWRLWQLPEKKSLVRTSVELGADATLDFRLGSAVALSPDGTRMVFVDRGKGTSQLYVRTFDQLKATPLAGTDAARQPFFSPDGEWIGFFTQNKLKKVSVQGGAVVTLCDAPAPRGGSWGGDNKIIAALKNGEALSWMDSAGGEPELLTQLDKGEVTHRWPQILPGGKAVLYTTNTSGDAFDNASLAVYSSETGKSQTVLQGGSYARYVSSGHLMYMHQGTLFAVPFDLKRLEVTGKAVAAIEGVGTDSAAGYAQYAVSDSGRLLYVPGHASGNLYGIKWLEHDGKETPLRNIIENYNNLQFSPDGSRLALDLSSEIGKSTDIYIYDWKRDAMTRLTFAPESDTFPVWTPDGRWIAYSSGRTLANNKIYWSRSDGTGEAQLLSESKNTQLPGSWHPSGKFLAYFEQPGIWILPMEGDEKSGWKPGKPYVFLNGAFWPAFSPDGRWIAYTSGETGRFEVYVRPFPSGEGKWQISNESGTQTIWSKNGKELFFRSISGKIMVAEYKVTGDSFQADKPKIWADAELEFKFTRNFTLHPDGKRFAILQAPKNLSADEKHDKFVLVENFGEELRRIAPTDKK